MSEIPADLKYTESHEWVRLEGDGVARIGITDHAQSQLGDLVFVELPEEGASLDAGDACAVVESVKAASDVYTPLTGKVVEVNTRLEEAPETINSSAFEDGWIFALKLEDESELEGMMDAEAYAEHSAD